MSSHLADLRGKLASSIAILKALHVSSSCSCSLQVELQGTQPWAVYLLAQGNSWGLATYLTRFLHQPPGLKARLESWPARSLNKQWDQSVLGSPMGCTPQGPEPGARALATEGLLLLGQFAAGPRRPQAFPLGLHNLGARPQPGRLAGLRTFVQPCDVRLKLPDFPLHVVIF